MAKIEKRTLTDTFVRSLKPAAPGRRNYFWDTKVDGFGVAVTDRGAKSWILYRRYPPDFTPSRRRIGSVSDLPLADAREKAAEWARLVALGRDPAEEKRLASLEAQRRRRVTFSKVPEDWFAAVVRKQKKGYEVERDVRREFLVPLGDLPIADVTTLDVRNVVAEMVSAGCPAQARNLLGYAKRLLAWAVEQHTYGLTESPAEKLRPTAICGKKEPRQRVLDDAELRAMWCGAGELNYPLGPLYRMLILTGQRLSEVSESRWSEFQMEKRLWTIPAERMKGGITHVVPIADDLLALLASLPRFRRGDHLFSHTFGETPVNGWASAKQRLRRAMQAELGDAPEQHWTNHDIRRTMRTHLSALPIQDNVRELMIAHVQKGMHKVYDQWTYVAEKRHGFELWERRLRDIVDPPTETDNVVTLRVSA